jgi:acyl carrier protein
VSDVKLVLRELICEHGALAPDFDPTANLYLDLGLPSMKAMLLLAEIEDKFGVAVPDDDYVVAASLDALAALVGRLVSERDGSA